MPERLEILSFLGASGGRQLKHWRMAAGLTQQEVAKKSGVRVETVSRIECGLGNPTVGTLRAIIKAVGEH